MLTMRELGKDATVAFDEVNHSQEAMDMLKERLVGDIDVCHFSPISSLTCLLLVIPLPSRRPTPSSSRRPSSSS